MANSKQEHDPHWLDHRERRNRSGFGRYPSRRERARDELLRDWYGPDLGREVILSHRRPAQPVGDGIPELMKQLGRSLSLEMDTLQRKWSDVVGVDLAKRTRPVFLRDGVLTVEVLQATWLYVLKTTGKGNLLRCVSDFTEGKVLDVQFVPGGRRHEAE